MARVLIPDQNRTIEDVQEIRQFLEPFGIWYEHWEVEGRLPAQPTDAQILETYAPEIEKLKQRGGFVTADVINVSSQTPNLMFFLQSSIRSTLTARMKFDSRFLDEASSTFIPTRDRSSQWKSKAEI